MQFHEDGVSDTFANQVSLALFFPLASRKLMSHFVIRALVLLALGCFPFQARAAGPAADPVSAATPLKVLFVGNSYTYFNDMPGMLAAMTRSSVSSRKIQTTASTIPAATLQMLWRSHSAKAAIDAGKWDFVVLQEQSTTPLTDPENMFKYARKFDAAIRKAGAKTIFFLTWARRDEPENQAALNRAYARLATELHAQIAPVGPAWKVASGIDATMPLYIEDGSHQTPTGAYLNACVFYLVMLGNQQRCPSIATAAVTQANLDVARTAAFQAVSANH
jgi:hypothetical protein